MMPTASKELKIVIFGTGGVGKSALSMQYVQSVFVEKYDPTIEDSYRKVIEVPGEWLGEVGPTALVLEIMDTAGTDQFTAMRDLYMRNGDAFLFVYSIDSKTSLDALGPLYEQLLRSRGASPGSLPVLLVGNKCDLESEREVSRLSVEELVGKWRLPPAIETSARRNINVSEAFLHLVQIALFKRTSKTDSPLSKKLNDKKQKCLFM